MDNVRERITELNKAKQKKLIIGIIAVALIIVLAISIEKTISMRVTDFTINKNDISETATFIPLKSLGTNLIAVKLSDDDYRLAFDACTGCYVTEHKGYGFKNNKNNSSLVCMNCGYEIFYEEMGFGENAMPYPIYINEISETAESFTLTEDYLEQRKILFEQFEEGNTINSYSENPSK